MKEELKKSDVLKNEFSLQLEEKEFSELTTKELYDFLQLRSEIFVVEQDCVYLDIDGKDQKAIHILGKIKEEIIAYARCFPPEIYFEEAAIGRVVVKNNFRGKKIAHQLMKKAIYTIENKYKTSKIKISAQQHLTDFYTSHGFKTIGKPYLEDGIPHVEMIKK